MIGKGRAVHTANVRILKQGHRYVVTDCYGNTVENTASMRWALYRYVDAGATGRIAHRALEGKERHTAAASVRPTPVASMPRALGNTTPSASPSRVCSSDRLSPNAST